LRADSSRGQQNQDLLHGQRCAGWHALGKEGLGPSQLWLQRALLFVASLQTSSGAVINFTLENDHGNYQWHG
jgi:hypothetical protein